MWPYPRIIAHRGGGTLAPENTMAGLRRGLEYGYRGVEFDVMLSRDGVPVLMHDQHFGRTIAGRGNVADTLAKDLMRMDAGAWHSPAFAGETVPGFSEVFDFCAGQGLWMNVEIKPADGHAARTGSAVADLVAGRLERFPTRAAQPLLSSFSLDALAAARATAPQLALALLVREIPPDWQDALRGLNAVALHASQRYLQAQQVAAVRAAGYGMFCYTVNEVARARELFSWGVDAFCTDRLDLFRPDFTG